MRAWLGWSPALVGAVLLTLALVVTVAAPGLPFQQTLTNIQDGYFADDGYNEEVIDVSDDNWPCPSPRVLRSRDTCRVAGAEVQCMRLHCCDTHQYIAGRCIPKTVDPCSLRLCEQACGVRGDGLWCSCHKGYTFHVDNYRRRMQPFCVDVDECAVDNGGCEQRCVNDPGGFHCECAPPLALAVDERRCLPPNPMPLVRASSRCLVSCETVARLSRRVAQLAEQLDVTQRTLHKLQITESERIKDGSDQFAEGNFAYRVLDATAPLEGGYCRCERGPRGPPGPPGAEGPKGAPGLRGPRGNRGSKGSLDLMLLLLADLRHDIRNLEARVYKDGYVPERFNLQQAWRRQRKEERELGDRGHTQPILEAYTVPPPTVSPVVISPNGLSGEIRHDDTASTTDWSRKLADTEPHEQTTLDDRDPLLQFRLLVNATSTGDEDEESEDYEYSFY